MAIFFKIWLVHAFAYFFAAYPPWHTIRVASFRRWSWTFDIIGFSGGICFRFRDDDFSGGGSKDDGFSDGITNRATTFFKINYVLNMKIRGEY